MGAGAYEEAVQAISLDAVADHSGDNAGINRFVIVATTADNSFSLAGANARVDGVLLTKPAAGQPGRIGISGIVPVELSGTVTRSGLAKAAADGKAAAHDSTNPVAGVFLASGVAGDIVPVLLGPQRN
jgi:hypothetical protein